MLEMANFIHCLYVLTLFFLSLYGFHRYYILYLYFKHKKKAQNKLIRNLEVVDIPSITVQLPIYNELYVVDRIIQAVTNLDYPSNKLEIQVLDDSTDETTDTIKQCITRLQSKGMTITHIHRTNRHGFKAGALQAGLEKTQADLIAVFDADFIPDSDFLMKTVPYFNDSSVGMVQARWGYSNREYSALTRVQALFLDGHFVLEHTARYSSGRYFNFNGTAGIWRRQAIIEAGGWQGDTLTEDLDLSYRSQMTGWRFVFLPDVICLSELPVDITAFKRQQFRWSKGAFQVARKLLIPIWKQDLSLSIKLEATIHLTSNICYIFMVILSILLPLSLTFRLAINNPRLMWLEAIIFTFTILSVSLFYLVSQRELYTDWKWKMRDLPFLFSLGIGMCLNNARAVVDGLLSRETPFERTPKYRIEKRRDQWKNKKYRNKDWKWVPLELAFFIYFVLFFFYLVTEHSWVSLPLYLLFLLGFAFVSTVSISHIRRRSS